MTHPSKMGAMRWLLLLGALAGCDSVFGLDDTALPKCVRRGFGEALPDPLITNIDVFSFTGDRDRAIGSIGGYTIEAEGSDGKNPTPIDIKPMYSIVASAFEPNGDYFFQTAAIEPPQILAVTKKDDEWIFDPHVPKGFIAGTPTNRMNNGKPVRVLVRLFPYDQQFQEYERDDTGQWFAVGDRFELKAFGGANMTQDGLAIVFDGFHKDDKRGVYIAQRATLDDSFEEPQMVLEGVHVQPQLFDDCGKLYAIDEGSTLVRYVR